MKYKGEYLNVSSEYDYSSTINSPTREKTCYDHMLKGSLQLDAVCAMVVDHLITDHKPVVIKIGFSKYFKHAVMGNLSRGFVNFKKLRQLLKNETWSEYKINVSRKQNKRTPWITKGLIKSINYKK